MLRMARDFIKNNKNGILLNSFEPELIANQTLSFLNMKDDFDVDEMRKRSSQCRLEDSSRTSFFSAIYKPIIKC